MKALFLRYVLVPLGFAYEICEPLSLKSDCHENQESSNSPVAIKPNIHSKFQTTFPESAEAHLTHANSARFSAGSTCWEFQNVGLRAGWYMLEIEHSLKSIGCILTVDLGAGQCHHMLLSSKPVCKRIIRLRGVATSCLAYIDLPDCSLARVTFKRLTGNFADRRMRQRLSNRGQYAELGSQGKDLLYDVYDAHVHDGIFELPYHSRAGEYIDDTCTIPVSGLRAAGTKLVLINDSMEIDSSKIDSSIDAALKFARKSGWKIEWQRNDESNLDLLRRCSEAGVFIMPVSSQVDYHIDIFHQMLNAIDSDNILIYADHDHVDETGIYHSPVLKPEWNPDLLLNMNYIQLPWMVSAPWALQVFDQGDSENSEGGICRVLLAAALGVKRRVAGTKSIDVKAAEQCEKSGVYQRSLIVEATEILPLSNPQVKRIPKVLASAHAPLHHDQSTAFFDTERWCKHVQQSLQVADMQAEVVKNDDNKGHHIRWYLPSDEPSVDIIVPTRDKVELLQACIESVIKKTSYRNYRLLVVDNDSVEASTQEYYRIMASEQRFNRLNYSGAFNYSAINNFAVQTSNADVIVLLNNDTEVIAPGWLDELVRQAIRSEIGCVGAKLYYSNGRIQHGGVIVGITGVAGHAHRYSPGDAKGYRGRLSVSQNFSAVTAACLAVRRSVWLQAGGLDEESLGVAWNDVDFCLKVQALGYRNLWTPHAELFHHEGLSRGADDTRSKIDRVDAERRVMLERWCLGELTDPAYHPLLTTDNESFTLSRSMS